MRIGLLEDDLAIQEMLLLVLQDEGHAVLNFSGAEECLEALSVSDFSPSLALPVDVMIIDWRLNGLLSGIEVITVLRKNPRFSELPLILTTAATFNDPDELRHLQVSLLEKPFSVDEMLLLIKELVQPYSPR
jgi:two-component system, chemotaxis family, chemotaxis protein CheY